MAKLRLNVLISLIIEQMADKSSPKWIETKSGAYRSYLKSNLNEN